MASRLIVFLACSAAEIGRVGVLTGVNDAPPYIARTGEIFVQMIPVAHTYGPLQRE